MLLYFLHCFNSNRSHYGNYDFFRYVSLAVFELYFFCNHRKYLENVLLFYFHSCSITSTLTTCCTCGFTARNTTSQVENIFILSCVTFIPSFENLSSFPMERLLMCILPGSTTPIIYGTLKVRYNSS